MVCLAHGLVRQKKSNAVAALLDANGRSWQLRPFGPEQRATHQPSL